MKYAVIAVAGAIVAGCSVLADALEARHNHSDAEAFALLGCVIMILGVLGVMTPPIREWVNSRK